MAPRSEKDDDLFNNSSMSFGEHLIELRRCLLNAIYWLVGGFILALIPWGSYSPSLSSLMVDLIQHPLRSALEDFYIKQAEKKYDDYFQNLGFEGEVKTMAKRHRMIPEEYWMFPDKDHKLMPTVPGNEETSAANNISADSVKKADENVTAANAENAKETVESTTEVPKPVKVVLWKKMTDDSRFRTKSLSAPETFVIYLKAAVFLGILLASPGIFYNFWSFVGAGLYAKEKVLVYRFLPLSIILFVSGCSLAFFVIFKMVLEFLFEFNASMNIDPDLRISEWLNFACILPVAFGVGFQLPLVMFALERLRIFTVQIYWARWKVSIFIIAFLSMMFTPPDPWSMICLLTALIILYFGGIFLCWLFPLPKSAFDDGEDADSDTKEPEKA